MHPQKPVFLQKETQYSMKSHPKTRYTYQVQRDRETEREREREREREKKNRAE
jgi:hypothetical protein